MLDLLLYIDGINKKCVDKMVYSTSPEKDQDTKQLFFKDYNLITDNNYTIAQLRSFLKKHKLKTSGTKPEIQKRLFYEGHNLIICS